MRPMPLIKLLIRTSIYVVLAYFTGMAVLGLILENAPGLLGIILLGGLSGLLYWAFKPD